MTFCFRCKACDTRWESHGPEHWLLCPNKDCNKDGQVIRDYRAECSNVFTFTNALGEGKSSVAPMR